MPAHKIDIRSRIEAKTVLVESGCHEWTGCRDKNGYGGIQHLGEKRRVHRVVWELSRGSIPAGMVVCHRCDNPACLNLDHLFLGSVADNNADKFRKGRHSHGSSHGMAKLSASDVEAIRAKAGQTNKQIAAEFAVSASLVGQIRQGLIWRSAA